MENKNLELPGHKLWKAWAYLNVPLSFGVCVYAAICNWKYGIIEIPYIAFIICLAQNIRRLFNASDDSNAIEDIKKVMKGFLRVVLAVVWTYFGIYFVTLHRLGRGSGYFNSERR